MRNKKDSIWPKEIEVRKEKSGSPRNRSPKLHQQPPGQARWSFAEGGLLGDSFLAQSIKNWADSCCEIEPNSLSPEHWAARAGASWIRHPSTKRSGKTGNCRAWPGRCQTILLAFDSRHSRTRCNSTCAPSVFETSPSAFSSLSVCHFKW